MAFNWTRGPKGAGWLMLFAQFVPSGPPTVGSRVVVGVALDRLVTLEEDKKHREAEALALIMLMEQQC